MFPANNINGIKEQEELLEGSHAIILLFVKPSDDNADNIIRKFNYLHYKSKGYCSIYLVGYSQYPLYQYEDAEEVKGIKQSTWYYSDQCFVEACETLQSRLKNWNYSGEPEMIILQNSSTLPGGRILDFRNYNYIDINYGIQHDYIDSFPRFMERIINACKSETEAAEVIKLANRKRLNCRRIIELAIESDKKLPKPIKKIFKDKAFYKSYRDAA